MTRKTRNILIALCWVLTLTALGGAAWLRWGRPTYEETLAQTIGPGDYSLTTTSGTAFTEASLKGGPTAVFFGFTHCPEVCPTSLGDIATWQEDLGPDNQLRVFFVTVDPERDTLDQLRDYVAWAPGVEGVSGPRAEIDKAIRAFRIFARKVPLEDGDYTMDHSSGVLLFDRRGRFFGVIGYQEGFDRALAQIRRLQDAA